MAAQSPDEVSEVKVVGSGNGVKLVEEPLGFVETGEKHLQARHWEGAVAATGDGVADGNLVQEDFDERVVEREDVCSWSAGSLHS